MGLILDQIGKLLIRVTSRAGWRGRGKQDREGLGGNPFPTSFER